MSAIVSLRSACLDGVHGSLTSGGSSPDYYETQTEELYVCGLADNGVPACSDALVPSFKHQRDEGDVEYSLKVQFPSLGGALLTSEAPDLAPEAQKLLGLHQLSLR